MSGNTLRNSETEETPKDTYRESKSLFALLDDVVGHRASLFRDGLPVRYLPKILFLAAVAIVYIANSHFADRAIRKIQRLKTEVEDLRADYTTLKSDYMVATIQSNVLRRVAPMGLRETDKAPITITLEEE